MKNIKKILLILVILFQVVSLVSCTIDSRAVETYVSPSEAENLRIQMIQEVEPSVVAVITESGHGSGIIFKSEDVLDDQNDDLKRYYILTNNHVVENGGEMRIYFGAGIDEISVDDYQTYPKYDIAVVRIVTNKLLRVHEVAPINDEVITEIVKGQEVIAMGTPKDLNYFNYVTTGIISIPSLNYDNVVGLGLMHDASLNPGNSGGPLFNLNGELIGINVAKVSNIQTSEGSISSEGLNFALSINKIAPIIKDFKEENYVKAVRTPKLGVTIQSVELFLTENDASLLPDNPVGVVVVGFDDTREAKKVLKTNDLIIKINDKAVTTAQDIALELVGADFNDIYELTVLRKVDDVFVEITVLIPLS